MKILKKILLVFCTFSYIVCYSQKNTIELPISVKNGLGPFTLGLIKISSNSTGKYDPWNKTYLKILGTPGNLIDMKEGNIETNIYQTIYQNYLTGNITKEFYAFLQKSWNWIPDTINLSRKPLKCKIAFCFGKDITGKTQIVVDVNNNLDLRDDPIFTPVEIDLDNANKVNMDSLVKKNTIMFSYECFSGNKIIQEKAQLLIVYIKKYDYYMCGFPQYVTSRLDGVEMAICSDDFTNLSYNKSNLVLMSDSLRHGEKAKPENVISNGKCFTINGNLYRNKGVSLNKRVLILEKIDQSKNRLYSTQKGFQPPAFEGQNFKSKTVISSNDYKGKYVLLDFWAVWCGPCRQQFPYLKTLYDKIDKSKIEIIGIVGDSPVDALQKVIDQYSITWPQILSDEKNKIKEMYGITGYPTIILINPEGVVVANGLKGNDLEKKIDELIGN